MDQWPLSFHCTLAMFLEYSDSKAARGCLGKRYNKCKSCIQYHFHKRTVTIVAIMVQVHTVLLFYFTIGPYMSCFAILFGKLWIKTSIIGSSWIINPWQTHDNFYSKMSKQFLMRARLMLHTYDNSEIICLTWNVKSYYFTNEMYCYGGIHV